MTFILFSLPLFFPECILCENGNFPGTHDFRLLMKKEKKLSSFEKILLGLDVPNTPKVTAPLRKGSLCPHCGEGLLDYNGMLQLECPSCGYVNGEGGGCT